MSFHTNRTLLSATYSNFKADNKCDFKSNILHIFWYYSALLSSIFSTFWCFLDESVLFFTFFRYRFTQIAPYYRPLFRIFRPIRSVVLRVFFHILRYYSALLSSIFSTFWTFNKCDFIFFSLENENCKIFSWSGVSIIGFLLSFSLFIFHFFRFSFFVFQFSVFVFVICFQFFVFWFSFLLFVFRFSLFVFIFFASSFCARRALLAGPRFILFYF